MNPRSTTAILARRRLVTPRLDVLPRPLWWAATSSPLPAPTRHDRSQPRPRDWHGKRVYSTSETPSPLAVSSLEAQEFHQISDQTLDDLTEALERLVESDHPQVTGWDVDYSSGVMNFSLGDHGTYVINKQPPNKQIWLSSPFSGPKRFDYDKKQKCWFSSRDGNELLSLLVAEIDGVLGDRSFSTLSSSLARH